MIKVKATGNDGLVVVHEQNEKHENGEAFIFADGGEKTHQVGETPAIMAKIRSGELKQVKGGRPPKDPKKETE